MKSLTLLTLLASATAFAGEALWSNSQECQNPESAYFDSTHAMIFVSNVAGSPDGKDGVGWIDQFATDGKLLKGHWVEGLNAPKGLRAYNDTLWVADIDTLVGIDIPSGKVSERIAIPGSKMLNDIAVDQDGTVYVSDTFADAIFKVQNSKASRFAEKAELESPNGLLIVKKQLIVAAWGKTTDWTTKVPGHLYALDLKSGKKTFITPEPFGNLDGLEVDTAGNYLVSDWSGGKGRVFEVDSHGKATTLFTLAQGAADIGYVPELNLVIIPEMSQNRLTALPLPSTKPVGTK